MHSSRFVLALAAAFFTAIPSIHALPSGDLPSPSNFETVTVIPDGAYEAFTYPNGTVVATSIDTIEKRTYVRHVAPQVKQRSAGGLEKRFVSCWNQPLDHTGVDRAANCLRNRANQAGGIDLRSGAGPYYYTCISSAVQVYYCVNAGNSWGNANLVDVNYGLSQMDSHCAAYDASYFQWDGTVEIVGKAKADTPICQG
ncbi:hypothetical protein B0T22DRAFT_515290 [Podospora appendiculata]|uniref:Secreted protein n=1 Tax=Podospora appendiculata TaxID=314037 RepID=A0AAE0XD77_9PEZI|nr:hypothetical protein B0T22DRAFT_515290 [Podospora appendiculata]